MDRKRDPAFRRERVRALGNAVVPANAAMIGRAIRAASAESATRIGVAR
jgi:hypothetical protein